jgi:aminoglycoside 2''-phosphotransferase
MQGLWFMLKGKLDFSIPDQYVAKIRAVYPNLSLDRLEFNQDGMNNDVVIVNQKLVCRFPKTDWAREALKEEIKILQVAQKYIDLSIPQLDYVEDGFVSYSFIHGEPLSRHQLFKLDPLTQEKVIEQLGQFFHQLHSISGDVVAASNILTSVAEQSQKEMLDLYEQVQQVIFPYLWKHQRTWVHEHFEPLVNGKLSLDTSHVLIHGDLGCYHILFDPDKQAINGIIDFGTAGIGNPAIDLAALLDNHGETVLKRMSKYYSGVEKLIDQARFRAGVVWLQWALIGLQHKDTELLLAHLGSSARDIKPIGASW